MIGRVRRALRRGIPAPTRLKIALLRRSFRDRWSGAGERIVVPECGKSDLTNWTTRISIEQPIRPGLYWEGKMANLRLAAERLNGVVIAPGDIFSFWAMAGAPTEANGYQAGRSIRNDLIEADIGGGLCQISGLAYELGLRSGMQVLERYPHTKDLYDEATRFTPLGLDATVVWGHKDLRLRNIQRFPLAFVFEVEAHRIVGAVFSMHDLPAASLEIDRQDEAACRRVRVLRTSPISATSELISSDVYRI